MRFPACNATSLLEFQRGCQTKPVHSAEAEAQTVFATTAGTQTEPQDRATEQLFRQNHDEPEPPGLKDFLQRVEDFVIRQLVTNARSHAFDGFQVNWEDQSNPVSRSKESNKYGDLGLKLVFCMTQFHVCRCHASTVSSISAPKREVFM